MNHREPPQLPAGVRRALHCLLLALPALAPEKASALPRTRPPGSGPHLTDLGAAPYLPQIGTLGLRFQDPPAPLPEPPPKVDRVAVPSVTAPPLAAVANANAAAVQSTGDPPSAATSPSTTPAPSDKTAAPASVRTPPAILPDSVRPSVRPEDFLPYFQVPGSATRAADVNLFLPSAPAAPASPGTLPASSATYTQSPK